LVVGHSFESGTAPLLGPDEESTANGRAGSVEWYISWSEKAWAGPRLGGRPGFHRVSGIAHGARTSTRGAGRVSFWGGLDRRLRADRAVVGERTWGLDDWLSVFHSFSASGSILIFERSRLSGVLYVTVYDT